MHENNKMQGFSLVELSIVLVILGLLTGGILGGQALIRAAEVRKLSEDFKMLIIAKNNYHLRFNALPGDHREATRFWPGQTQNGNGDGNIYDHWQSGDSADEDSKATQHLSLAGLISFTPDGTYFPQVVGENAPPTPFGGAGYRLESAPWSPSPTQSVYGRQGLKIVAGTVCPGSDIYCPFLSPADAWNIDTKFDDGAPGTGQWFAVGNNDECVINATNFTDVGDNEYQLSTENAVCNLMYWAE
jgi:prepilin-type N-terminal cleavage/methylation domain-containing protein